MSSPIIFHHVFVCVLVSVDVYKCWYGCAYIELCMDMRVQDYAGSLSFFIYIFSLPLGLCSSFLLDWPANEF